MIAQAPTPAPAFMPYPPMPAPYQPVPAQASPAPSPLRAAGVHGHVPAHGGHGHGVAFGGIPIGFGRRGLPGGLTRGRVLGGVAGAVVLAIVGGVGGTYALRGGGNSRTGVALSRLSIDVDAADPDRMIVAAGELARTWKRDAVWWAVNIHGVRPNGTVDLDSGGSATVTYISPRDVASHAKSVRSDSVKKFRFGAGGVRYDEIIGARDPWENVVPPPIPDCDIKQLITGLAAQGVIGNAPVRVTFDPTFAYGPGAPEEPSWHVLADAPKLDAWFSMSDCHRTK